MQVIKQLFCRHIERLEKSEYLYSIGFRVFGKFHESKRVVANHYVCVKCGHKRIKQEENIFPYQIK